MPRESKHSLYKQPSEKIKIPEGWDNKKIIDKKNPEFQELQNMEERIQILEPIIFPEGSNVITLPEGFDPDISIEDLEKEYKSLIPKYKELRLKLLGEII